VIRLAIISVLLVATLAAAEPTAPRFRVLVFSKTAGYRHGSIPDGIAAVRALGAAHGFAVDATEDAARFDDASLRAYAAVVFLSTTGDVLDDAQQGAFERFIRAGGGYVGIHAASDTEYDWPWYGRLVGAYFKRHPPVQPAAVRVTDRDHPSTRHLPARWERRDEWYDYRDSPRDRVRVLASLDETTYDGGGMGDDHPIAWCHAFEGGRAWYTGGGHTAESFAEPLFMTHVLGGIEWAAGAADEAAPDARHAAPRSRPEPGP
jgi:type 1 glutamine amidotransferase